MGQRAQVASFLLLQIRKLRLRKVDDGRARI
jgi:hypothetical protein